MRSWYAYPLFAFMFLGGMWIIDRSWNGQVYVYVGEQRGPAAVREMSDYSSFDRKALHRDVHTQLLAEAQIFKRDGQFGIELGHPLITRKNGKEFGCQIQDHSGAFDHLEMVFVGVGVSESGESARMIVNSTCQSHKNINKLDPIWIPMRDIAASRATDQVFPGDNALRVHLESIPVQWPESWVLWSITLYHEGPNPEALTIDTSLLKQARPKMIYLNNN